MTDFGRKRRFRGREIHATGYSASPGGPCLLISDKVALIDDHDKESIVAKPAARLTDPTSCPMPGHGAQSIASGSPDVFSMVLPPLERTIPARAVALWFPASQRPFLSTGKTQLWLILSERMVTS